MAKTKPSPTEHAIIRNAIVPIARLHPHPRNYNQHSAEQVQRIAMSLRRFGQPRSLVVWERDDGDYWIIAGHGVVLGAQSESWTEIRADILPRNYPEADALAFLVADNEIARLSEPDETALAELLQEQVNAGYDLESLGSSQEELDALLARLADEALDGDGGGLSEPPGGDLDHHLGVMAECATEDDQQRAYDLLTEAGFTCRILTL
jgi:ParB-like chromosome segregation protein Spo0J